MQYDRSVLIPWESSGSVIRVFNAIFISAVLPILES